MTDLTEQWKKGELLEGWYYVKDIHNKESLDRYFKETDNFEYLEDWEVDEVLAPVPSYEELQNMNEAVNQAIAANIKLVEENKQLKEQINHFKRILRMTKKYLREYIDGLCDEDCYDRKPRDLVDEINEVLK